jgi:hypothetical protein
LESGDAQSAGRSRFGLVLGSAPTACLLHRHARCGRGRTRRHHSQLLFGVPAQPAAPVDRPPAHRLRQIPAGRRPRFPPSIRPRCLYPLASATFNVPFRVAEPLTLSWSYCVPAVAPPRVTSSAPPELCVYVPTFHRIESSNSSVILSNSIRHEARDQAGE